MKNRDGPNRTFFNYFITCCFCYVFIVYLEYKKVLRYKKDTRIFVTYYFYYVFIEAIIAQNINFYTKTIIFKTKSLAELNLPSLVRVINATF